MATELYASGEAVAFEDSIPLSKVTGHSLVQERWTGSIIGGQIAKLDDNFEVSHQLQGTC
jgi:hypothetical protein